LNLTSESRRLCWLGILLVLLGLGTGALIPLFESPRQGLSAHAAGVQNGIMLTVLGLLWPHLLFRASIARLAATASVFSLYAIWVALVLAAAFGTSRTTPIAGAGREGEPWQEALIASVMGAGSVALVAAVIAVLWGLRTVRPSSE
jgi:hydroxylaminobenzene mutase